MNPEPISPIPSVFIKILPLYFKRPIVDVFDFPNDLTLLYALALLHLDAVHVGVAGLVGTRVVDLDEVPVAAVPSSHDDLTSARCTDRGAGWRTKVGSVVWSTGLEDGMESSGIESTRHP